MGTGIYRESPLGRTEVSQRDIDFWCSQCQFPFGEGRCTDKTLIMKCWDESGAVAFRWHLQHECPFTHKGEVCQCNEFKTLQMAFEAAGLPYKKGGQIT